MGSAILGRRTTTRYFMFGTGKPKDSQGPLAETRNWYSDRYQVISVQRNLLLMVTIVALLGVGAAVFAVAELTASKTFEPYVIEVEERTGITTLVKQDAIQTYTEKEMVKRYFIWHYVLARESYDIMDYEYNYGQVVRLFSSGDVYNGFYQTIKPSNPDSPVNLGRDASRRVKLKSMSFLDGGKAVQVRISIELVQQGAVKQTYDRIVTLEFGFNPGLELSSEERLINPLGFTVTSYRIDEDRG